MPGFLARRVLRALTTVFVVLTFAFVLGRATGKPAALLLPDSATPAEVDALNDALGFNRPLAEQYLDFLGGVLTGDLGDSYRQREPALGLVLERLPATFELAVWSFVIGLALAVAAALAVQLTASRVLRAALTWAGSARQAVPDFFFALVLVLVASVQLSLLPSLGRTSPASLVLPVLTLATGQFVMYFRLLGGALSAEAEQDYVRTAFAKGQNRRIVLLGHMFPNALLPVTAMAGLNFGALLGGTVVVETVFSWPGLGQLLTEAVNQRDFPVVQAALLVVALLFVVANLAVDVLTSLIDPRVAIS